MNILLILISLIICVLILHYKIIDSIQYDNFPYDKITKEEELENWWINYSDWWDMVNGAK